MDGARHRRIVLLVCAFLFGLSFAHAEEFSSANLWSGGIGGYATYRIPGVVVTAKGSVLVYAAARKTTGSDWADTDIVLRRSANGGKDFSPSRRIAGEGKGTTDNPTAIVDAKTRTIFLLYQTNYERCFVIQSKDDGISFSQPVEITDALTDLRKQFNWNVIAPGPTHGIQLKSGRLVVPVWMAAGVVDSKGHRAHAPSAVTTLFSDDHGKTWRHGDIVLAGDDDMKNPSETDIVQMDDQSVQLNMRSASDHHRRILSTSPDGATHWSKPVYNEALFEPVCNAGFVKYAPHKDGVRALLFSNPDTASSSPVKSHYPRRRLVVRASFDEGTTWPLARLIDAGSAAYSDLAVLPDGTILCFYESGAIDGRESDPAHLTLARFSLNWIRQ